MDTLSKQTTSVSSGSSKPTDSSKKVYHKPVLNNLGSVRQLTQTGSSTKADGTAMMR